MSRTTTIPFCDWPLRARLIERLYRLTHHGQIRTLVIGKRVTLPRLGGCIRLPEREEQ